MSELRARAASRATSNHEMYTMEQALARVNSEDGMSHLQVSSLALPDACAPLPEEEALRLQMASDSWPYTSWRAPATWLTDQDHHQVCF